MLQISFQSKLNYIILVINYLLSVESQYYYIIGNIGTDAHRDPENSFGIAVMGK